MLPMMRLSTAGYWICRISTLSSNTVNVSSIHTMLVQVDTYFRLGHFSLVWPDPIWYHYTQTSTGGVWCVKGGGGIHKCRYEYC